MNISLIIVGGVLLIVLLVLLIWYFRPTFNKKERRDRLMYSFYPTACAGSSKQEKPEEAKSVSVAYHRFYDKEGNALDPADYDQFVAEGNSMQFCGIHDKDLLFVAKGFRIVQLKDYPYILVLKNDDAKPGKSQYKVRRAWGVSHYEPGDRFENAVRKIMASEAFKEIKSLKGKDGNDAYKGDERVVEDFLTNRLPIYERKYIKCQNPDEWNKTVVISTTFDTDEKYIHFSIHPIANIVGIVDGSYTVINSDDKK